MDRFFEEDTIKDRYDLVVIGAGPAGCTAGLYASRDAISTLVVDSKYPGGNLSITETIENYPGFVEPINGADLALNFANQAIKHGAEIKYANIKSIELNGNIKVLKLENGKTIEAKALIIATGTNPKKLDVEGEARFIGRGISFCATCDAAFYRGKDVVVVGGGNSALEEALYLTKFVNNVTLIHRRDEFRATKIIQKRVAENSKIKVLKSTVITKIIGDKKVEAVEVKDLKTDTTNEVKIDGIFEFIGWNANTELFDGVIELAENKFINSDENMETSVKGIFVAGDVRKKELMQVITAVSDGALAAKAATHYIDNEYE